MKKNEDKKKKNNNVSLITLGEGQVGKTSIIYRYIDDTFTSNYLATIGIDSKFKKIKLASGEEIKVKILDTAGQERFQSIAANYIKKADGIVFVYDITKGYTFTNLEKWLSNIDEVANDKPCLLIGNKSDMNDKREVSKEEGMEFTKKFKKETHFYETSCKTGENVDKAINDLVNQIYSKSLGNEQGKGGLQLEKDSKNDDKNKKRKCC